jgi:hypothetical protein
MARPQRNNVDYFPFYCDEGEKMFYLEETYGNDGFATFLKLLRELAKVDFHYLNLSKKSSMMFLSAKCKVSIQTLESIISDLVMLEKFDVELWNENKIIWCQDFIDSIQDAYSKRRNSCIDKKGLLVLLESLGVRKQGKFQPKQSNQPTKGVDNSQSIVDNTKQKKRKQKTLFIDISDESQLSDYQKIAFSFWKLFKHTQKELGKVNTTTLDKANLESWTTDIRLLIETDKATEEELRKVWTFVKVDDFWRVNILSTSKLRKQFDKLLIKANAENIKPKKQQAGAAADRWMENKLNQLRNEQRNN